ncbi:amino acid adenylation domain protein (plasmid) [Gemmatirosa kalamazoonensis]|uniref:Amino acid adenylation domain protein n=1 Tax=Gemmatirosa kalamazoonensis TaxID=861299 RepID=W0RTE5_9BACT|nr:non-ribosomal peptide synthetase [Gemmatirosa kalamazoonensis]AHG93595.1 amino acid adenylation domain protein [Gemmatirosa kalamazoonensis]
MSEGAPALDRALEERLAKMSPAKRALFLKAAGLPVDYAPPAARTGIPRRPAGTPAPLSFAQELLWLLQAANPGFFAYNAPRAYRLRGPLDVRALQRALDAHVERHEIYRSVVRATDDGPVQEVRPARPVTLRVEDLREAGEAVVADRARDVMREPFDLARDQLLRAALFRVGDDEHVLVLVSHHIASDGWSRGVMFRELAASYEAALADVDAELPPLPIQYGDFAAWQREHLSGERLERLLAFWRDTLAGAPHALELPTDRPLSGLPSAEGARVQALFPPELAAALKALARAHDATLFMTLLAAWQVLLARYTGQDDVLVGTPIAGRTRPEVEGLVGYFADTLVVRARLGGAPTFAEHLARVRETSLAAFDHQEVPYEKLVLELASARGGSTAPLFQSLFTLHDDRPERLGLAGVQVERFAADGGWTKADVSLSAADRADGLAVVLEYRTDAFDRDRMERMLDHLRTLLEGIVAAPDTPVTRLPLIGAAERARMDAWNDTAREYSHDSTLIARIEAAVDRVPNAIALQVGRETLTFAELDARANRLARRLKREGVGPGVGVALCFERSFELVVGQLAAMKAGGHYVPLDPDYPEDRIAYMLEDSAAPVVLTDRAHRGVLPPSATNVLELDACWPEIARESGDRLPNDAAPSDLAYVIYTSGSTGRPKGVMIPHRAVVNYVEWMQRAFPLRADDCVLQKAPASFDASIWEFFLPLVAGVRLLLAKPGGHQDPDYLMGTVTRDGVTIMQLVPSQLQMVLETPSAEALSRLRLLVSGGEALPGDLLARLDRIAPVKLTNLYGPTECTVYATSWTHDPRVDGPHDGSPVPIGRPIDNARVYVVHPDTLERQPLGIPGELLIGGVQVARGYRNRAELTAEKFIRDPFGTRDSGLGTREGEASESRVPSPESRVYRTGDLARLRADGIVEYLGRIDNQVKLRGFRIELGEIEEALARHRAVRQCVVLLREDVPGDKRLVAYVAYQPGAADDAAALREFLRAQLPEYMVPAVFVALDAIPLNANGKADRRALPAPAGAESTGSATPYAPPRTTLEHELVEIWESLLRHRPIGIHDDFFAVGGHSLLAMRMLVEIERVRGHRLAVATLFEHSTIEALARVLAGEVEAAGEPPLVVLNPDAAGTPLVFVHGDVRGGGWYCRRLARYLPERPLIVLPTVRPDAPHGTEAPATIEAMARRHVAELRRVRPHGPYLVGGFCVGGLVAYEIAQQLAAAGERVELLVLVDTAALNAPFRRLVPLLAAVDALTPSARRLDRRAGILRSARYYRGRVVDVARRPLGEQLAWVSRNVRRRLAGTRPNGVPNAAPAAAPDGAPPVDARLGEDERLMGAGAAGPGLATLLHQQRAAVAYVQRPYAGAVHVVWASEVLGARRDPTRGWGRLVRGVRVSEVPSSHVGLITRHLPAFAERLAAVVRDADRS